MRPLNFPLGHLWYDQTSYDSQRLGWKPEPKRLKSGAKRQNWPLVPLRPELKSPKFKGTHPCAFVYDTETWTWLPQLYLSIWRTFYIRTLLRKIDLTYLWWLTLAVYLTYLGSKNLSWGAASIRLASGYICVAFYRLTIDVGGPRTLCMVLTWGVPEGRRKADEQTWENQVSK